MNTWNALAEKVIDWLLSTSWQAAVLAILVVFVQLSFRGMLSARWHYLLWLLVVGRLLIPSLPESPTSLYRYIPASPVTAIHEESVVSPVALKPVSISPTPTSIPATETPAAVNSAPISLKGVLLAVWLVGFLALAISLVVRNLRFRHAVLDRCRPATREIRELATSLARTMSISRPTQIKPASSLGEV